VARVEAWGGAQAPVPRDPMPLGGQMTAVSTMQKDERMQFVVVVEGGLMIEGGRGGGSRHAAGSLVLLDPDVGSQLEKRGVVRRSGGD
jgi:hypothetical protein